MASQQEEVYRELIECHRDELKEPYDELVEAIGVEGLVMVCSVLQGDNYIPSVKSLVSDIVKKKVRQEFNGYNFKQLSRKYGFSEKMIRSWIRSK